MAYIQHIPILQVRPNMLLVYEIPETPYPRKHQDSTTHNISKPSIIEVLSPISENPSSFSLISQSFERFSPLSNFRNSKPYSGLINPAASKKIKRSVNLLIASSLWKTATDFKTNKEFRWRVNFLTLTLPIEQGTTTDHQLKSKVLDPWIKTAKRRFKLGSYLWRAERQQNGNLHFHFLTDTYIPFDQLRDTWNDKLNIFGMIDKFEIKHGHRHPNSTDVHSVKNVRNLGAYISKYMAKGINTADRLIAQPPFSKPEIKSKANKFAAKFKRILSQREQVITGKVWDCSQNLKSKDRCEFTLDGDALLSWQFASNNFSHGYKKIEKCDLIFLNDSNFEKSLKGDVYSNWKAYLKRIREAPSTFTPEEKKTHANKLQAIPV